MALFGGDLASGDDFNAVIAGQFLGAPGALQRVVVGNGDQIQAGAVGGLVQQYGDGCRAVKAV